jgi:CMP/dCMP kinase
MKLLIAIDGPASSGKGTVGKYLALKHNLKYLDTGLMYRETARLIRDAVTNNVQPIIFNKLADQVNPYHFNEEELCSEEIAAFASKIASEPSLRYILTQKMREFINTVALPYKGVVLDGRDIGTVVLPEAHIKFYITADVQVRAIRRTNELKKDASEVANILIALKERDERDSTRILAPMKAAIDANVLDTTFLDITAACEKAEIVVEETLRKLSIHFLH